MYGYTEIFYSDILYLYNWTIPQCVMVLKLIGKSLYTREQALSFPTIDLATSLYDGSKKEVNVFRYNELKYYEKL